MTGDLHEGHITWEGMKRVAWKQGMSHRGVKRQRVMAQAGHGEMGCLNRGWGGGERETDTEWTNKETSTSQVSMSRVSESSTTAVHANETT